MDKKILPVVLLAAFVALLAIYHFSYKEIYNIGTGMGIDGKKAEQLAEKAEPKVRRVVTAPLKQMPSICLPRRQAGLNAADIEKCITEKKIEGAVPEEEIEAVKMVLKAVGAGLEIPCLNKDVCVSFCRVSTNLEECLVFAETAGFLTKGEADLARKTGAKGPGQCQSKEECDAYCQNLGRVEECVQFGLKYGLMTKTEADKILESLQLKESQPEGMSQPLPEQMASSEEEIETKTETELETEAKPSQSVSPEIRKFLGRVINAF